MGAKQREWGIFIRPYYERKENGITAKEYITFPNEDMYIGDKTPVKREVSYVCNGNRYYRHYWLPKFIERTETRSFSYTCNGRTYTINYCSPILNPHESVEIKGDNMEDGIWSLYYTTTSYTFLMEKLQEMHEDLEIDLEHIKVVELFDLDVERMMLTWEGGERGETN